MSLKKTYHFEQFREEQKHRFSDVLCQEGGFLYLTGSFRKTDEILETEDGKRTVLRLTPSGEQTLRKVYEQADSFFPEESLKEAYFEHYSEPQAIYTADLLPAAEFVRECLETDGNFHEAFVVDMGAEFLDGKGITEPLHTLQLYKIADENYRVHYLLSTSLAMLEVKSNALHNAPEFDYQDDKMFGEDGFEITLPNLAWFMLALIQDYFGTDPHTLNLCGHAGIMELFPGTADFLLAPGAEGFDIIRNAEYHYRIGMLLSTDEIIEKDALFRPSL